MAPYRDPPKKWWFVVFQQSFGTSGVITGNAVIDEHPAAHLARLRKQHHHTVLLYYCTVSDEDVTMFHHAFAQHEDYEET